MSTQQPAQPLPPAHETRIAPAPKVTDAAPSAIEMDELGLYKVKNHIDERRIARMLIETKAVPSTFKTPEQVMMAIQALKSLNLNWRTAIRQCGFNAQGVFMIYGDLELALVRASGMLVDLKEFLYVQNAEGKLEERCFANSNLQLPWLGAVCQVKRKGSDHYYETSFSIEDAKLSGLWGKTPTWRSFPQRMATMRARSIALRGAFPDITQGVAGVEYDHDGIDYGKP